MMNKRNILLGLISACVPLSVARAAITRNHAEWIVPPGVRKINVKSWKKNGTEVMNYNFSVEPGQTFELTAK
jgi:hypothetical protein